MSSTGGTDELLISKTVTNEVEEAQLSGDDEQPSKDSADRSIKSSDDEGSEDEDNMKPAAKKGGKSEEDNDSSSESGDEDSSSEEEDSSSEEEDDEPYELKNQRGRSKNNEKAAALGLGAGVSALVNDSSTIQAYMVGAGVSALVNDSSTIQAYMAAGGGGKGGSGQQGKGNGGRKRKTASQGPPRKSARTLASSYEGKRVVIRSGDEPLPGKVGKYNLTDETFNIIFDDNNRSAMHSGKVKIDELVNSLDDVDKEKSSPSAVASTSTELATSKSVTRRKSPRVHDSKYKKDDVVVALIAPIDGGRKYPEPRKISEIVYTQDGGVWYSMYDDDGEYQESDIVRLHVFKDIDDDTFTAGPVKKNKKYNSTRKTSSEGHTYENKQGYYVNEELSEKAKEYTAGKGFNLDHDVKADNEMQFIQRVGNMCKDDKNTPSIKDMTFNVTKETVTIPAKWSNGKSKPSRTEQRLVVKKKNVRTNNSKPIHGLVVKNLLHIIEHLQKGKHGMKSIKDFRAFNNHMLQTNFQRVLKEDSEDLKDGVLLRQNVSNKKVTDDSQFFYVHPDFDVNNAEAIRGLVMYGSKDNEFAWKFEDLKEG